MTPRMIIACPLIAALASCGTPQEQCIRTATRDLRTVESLIDESKANLARGYAYESINVTRTEWVICDYVQGPPAAPGGPPPPPRPRYCLDDVTDTVRKPVAIDPAAERRKLAALTAKQTELNRRAVPGIAACRAQYPGQG